MSESTVSITPKEESKHNLEIICAKIYDSSKKDDYMQALHLYDELVIEIQNGGIPENNIGLRDDVMKTWGRAAAACIKSSGDVEHAQELVGEFETLVYNSEPCSYLRARVVPGDRPAAVLQGYHKMQCGPIDDGAVDGCLDQFTDISGTDVLEFMAVLDSLNCEVTPKISERLQKCYVVRMKKEDPEVVLEEMKADGLTPTTPQPYNFIFFKPNCTRKKLMEYYEEMLDLGIRPAASTLRILTKRSDLTKEEMNTLRRQMKGEITPTEAQMAKLRSISQDQNIEAAEKFIQRMCMEGIVPDKHIYNTLLDRCSGNPGKAEEIYNQMLEKGIKPNNLTFTKLMSIWKDCKLPEGVDRWVQEMNKHSIKPDMGTASNLIDNYVRSGQRAKAQQQLVTILTCQSGNVHMFNTLMKLGPFDFAVGVLGFLLSEGLHVAPSARTTITNLSRDPIAQSFVQELEKCDWESDRILSNKTIISPDRTETSHPSLQDCMRLVMREIKLDDKLIEVQNKKLQIKIDDASKNRR
eukprot:Tbor_TRINITY_DN690_c0_g1::TRINITY_DN690_c0_g1_i1::g.1557::m.1557